MAIPSVKTSFSFIFSGKSRSEDDMCFDNRPAFETGFMPDLSDEERKAAFYGLQSAVSPGVVNVVLLDDVSGSRNPDDIRYTHGPWFKHLCETYREKGKENNLRYNLAFVEFNHETNLLLPFTYVDEIAQTELAYQRPSGFTHMEEAVEFCLDLIEKEKARQDAERARGKKIDRAGTLLILTTDGKPQYTDGYRELSEEFVQRMAELNAKHKVTSLAFLYGNGGADCIKCIRQIAPERTIKIGGGRSYNNPHAFVFDLDQVKREDSLSQAITLLMNIVERGSSSSCTVNGSYTTEPVFLPHGTQSLDGVSGDVIELPSYVIPAKKVSELRS